MAIKGVFVGYATSAMGYKIYNLEAKQVFVNWNVIFNESSYWDFKNKVVVLDLPFNLNITNDDSPKSICSKEKVALDDILEDDIDLLVKLLEIDPLVRGCLY